MPSITTPPPLVTPGDEAYDAARQAWNLAADPRPAAVATATTVDEVRAVIAHARSQGLRVTARGTGHLASALPSLERTLLLKTQMAGPIAVDAAARTARVPAGTTWEPVVMAAAEHGLTALHGSSPDVGVVGYTLGGGLSFYAREHGMAANHVRAIEVVTADGEPRRVDGEHDPDLFWALRGGGGAFGVVTAIEIELMPIERVYAGAIFWPVSDAPAVMRAWVDWCATAPSSITSSMRILNLPPLPEVPEPLRGVPHIAFDGAFVGDAAAGAESIAPLRAAAPPKIDMFAEVPATAVMRIHGDPEEPVPYLSRDAMLGPLDEAAIDAFLAVAGEGSGSPLVAAELRQLGGALREAPAGAGVTGSMPAEFMLFGVGMMMAPEHAEAMPPALERVISAMRPWETGLRYLNFAEAGGSAEACFAADAYARLVRTRREWDPDGLFVSSHDIS